MEKVITIFDWWDGPLCGLATYRGAVCIYERIFDEAEDEWSGEYYLTPIGEDAASTLLKDWAAWCEAVRGNAAVDNEPAAHRDLYRGIVQASAEKRAYKKAAVFHGSFGKGFIPIDYGVEWIER